MYNDESPEDALDEMLRKRRKVGIRKHRAFYYILAATEGRRVLLGPYSTEEEANSVGFSKLDGTFEVVMLPTSDRSKATQIVKERRLDETSSLKQAMQRMGHQA